MTKKYTKDTIIEAIKRFYTETGRIPQAKDFVKNKNYPSFATVQKYFGSWNTAIEASGFMANIQPSYTAEELIEAIQRFYTETGRIPQTRDFNRNPEYPDSSTVQKYFGSWNNGIEASGFMANIQPSYTAEELIEAIKRFYIETGRIPQMRDFNRNPNYPSCKTVQNYFGSWDTAIEASGFTAYSPDKYTTEELIEAIKRFYIETGRIPQMKDFNRNPNYPCFATVQRQFGSWNNGIEASGFTPNIRNRFGVKTKGLDGHLYRSQAEAYLSDNYLHGKYTYDIEPRYPKPYILYYDWYIHELDMYIELDGGLRPERIKYKTQLNKRLGRNCLVIPIAAIYRKDFNVCSHNNK